MAGLGRKVWTAGEVLAAADVNGYLMDQTVMVFDDATARSSAIGTPTAGMMSFLVDIAQVQAYGGTAIGWTPITGGGSGGFETNFLLMGA